MDVRELIEELSRFPGDMPVTTYVNDVEMEYSIGAVDEYTSLDQCTFVELNLV